MTYVEKSLILASDFGTADWSNIKYFKATEWPRIIYFVEIHV